MSENVSEFTSLDVGALEDELQRLRQLHNQKKVSVNQQEDENVTTQNAVATKPVMLNVPQDLYLKLVEEAAMHHVNLDAYLIDVLSQVCNA